MPRDPILLPQHSKQYHELERLDILRFLTSLFWLKHVFLVARYVAPSWSNIRHIEFVEKPSMDNSRDKGNEDHATKNPIIVLATIV